MIESAFFSEAHQDSFHRVAMFTFLSEMYLINCNVNMVNRSL